MSTLTRRCDLQVEKIRAPPHHHHLAESRRGEELGEKSFVEADAVEVVFVDLAAVEHAHDVELFGGGEVRVEVLRREHVEVGHGDEEGPAWEEDPVPLRQRRSHLRRCRRLRRRRLCLGLRGGLAGLGGRGVTV